MKSSHVVISSVVLERFVFFLVTVAGAVAAAAFSLPLASVFFCLLVFERAMIAVDVYER